MSKEGEARVSLDCRDGDVTIGGTDLALTAGHPLVRRQSVVDELLELRATYLESLCSVPVGQQSRRRCGRSSRPRCAKVH